MTIDQPSAKCTINHTCSRSRTAHGKRPVSDNRRKKLIRSTLKEISHKICNVNTQTRDNTVQCNKLCVTARMFELQLSVYNSKWIISIVACVPQCITGFRTLIPGTESQSWLFKKLPNKKKVSICYYCLKIKLSSTFWFKILHTIRNLACIQLKYNLCSNSIQFHM